VISEETAARYAAVITWTLALLFFTTALVIAYVIPLHAQDALTFGEWSRLIAQNWHFHYAAVTGQEYGRPLFYVLQGWLWGAIGVDDSSGRILALFFSLLLLGAFVWLMREERDWGILAGLLAVLALLATPVFAFQMVAGLTDVPVTAFVALAGALVWGRRPSGRRAVAVGAAAALAMLTKPSALLALAGLVLAQLLVGETWRNRLLYRVVPLCAGIAAGLVYDLTQANYVHEGLRTFLQSGVNTDYYRTLADEARRYAVFDGNWFGDGLRVAAFFALFYAALRLAGVRHRLAVSVGLPLALLASWLGPWFAAHQDRLAVGALHSPGAAAAAVGMAAFLAFGLLGDRAAIPARGELARFAVWALPTAVAWAVYGAYDARLLAPAWPPLLALVVLAALPAASAFARRGPLVLALPFALFAVVVASNVYNLDGLHKSGWDQLRRTDDWFNRDETRAIVLPALSRALIIVRHEMRPGDSMMSPEGAFRFFYPGHVSQSFPNSCEGLRPFRVFVLTTDEGSKRYMEDFLHVSGEPSFWAACASPHLTQLSDGSEGYAVFRVDT
jgi:4-amino-4-deoxy-L-arabinose transferase-like glycosyltransferase